MRATPRFGVSRPARSSAPLIVDRTLKDRDLAGHFSTGIREEQRAERKKTWWTWYGQRRHDLDAVFKSRYCVDGAMMPQMAESEAVARAMAFHLQAYEGPERVLQLLHEWFEEVLNLVYHGGPEPNFEEIAASVSHRRRDITAISAGQLLQVTWEERCRLRLRTIRPCDLTPAEFKAAIKQRKRDMDRDRARRTRRRQRKPERAEYRWEGESEPWMDLGISRSTWTRAKRQGDLCRHVAACPIAVADWLVSFCRGHDHEVAKRRIDAALRSDQSTSQLGVASERADALSSTVVATYVEESAGGDEVQVVSANTSSPPSSSNLSTEAEAAERARGEAGERNARDARCPPRVASNRNWKEQAA